MIGGLALVAICIAGETARELLFKQAATDARPFLRRPLLWAGLAVGIAEALLWIGTLTIVPPAVALPLMALSFATVPLAAQLLLRERLARRQIAGILLISAGAVCVGLAGTPS